MLRTETGMLPAEMSCNGLKEVVCQKLSSQGGVYMNYLHLLGVSSTTYLHKTDYLIQSYSVSNNYFRGRQQLVISVAFQQCLRVIFRQGGQSFIP